MKIAVIGTGGVGGYFGGKIANAGFDVTFVARGEHLQALRQNGLIVKSIDGDFKVQNVNATENISDLKSIDLFMIATKAWQVKNIAKELQSTINKGAIILPMQNGVLTADELAEFIPTKNILGGLCKIISKIEASGIINHFGIEPTIIFGELNNEKTERANKLFTIFTNAGIKTKIADDIQAELWKKFIPICVSALLAVTKTTYGELREIPETRQLAIELINEIYSLSQKIGIKIESSFVERAVSFIDSFPYNSTSSLTRDVWEGKPSEIEYQNGTVVKLGEKYNVPTPVNRFIYNCVLPMEKKARNSVL